jgi:hypothetical protein
MSGPDDWDRNNSAPGNGSVGYGRPPVAKQFKPGQSGNPRGRKKGVKNVATIFNDALYRPVKIRIAGRARTLPKIEAIVEVMMSKALAGDSPAVSRIFELAHKLGGFAFLANSTSSSLNRESESLEALKRLLDLQEDAPLDAPESSDGTPEPNSDQKKAKE